MKLRTLDYALVRLMSVLSPALVQAGDLETQLLKHRLQTITPDAQIFITGLARAGTTILLETLAKFPTIATHRYRDFPFLFTCYGWNYFVEHFSRAQPPVERPHQDGIFITRESPEAFEEMIWRHFFPTHNNQPDALLLPHTHHAAFEQFLVEHMQKILLIRGGTRYVSKGNYNVLRIEYLAKLFPRAHFLIPIRTPAAHVHSLVEQHHLFHDYAKQDPRIAHYLSTVGHFEFGAQRRPICFTHTTWYAIKEAWAAGDEYTAYAHSWTEIYGYVHTLKTRNDALSSRIHWVKYDELCAKPQQVISTLLTTIDLTVSPFDLQKYCAGIATTPPKEPALAARDAESVARLTSSLANLLF